MAESMKDFEQELEASFKKIEEGDIIAGTVVSVDETGVVLDLKYYAEGFIPAEEFSREPGFNIKEAVQPGEEIQATVLQGRDCRRRDPLPALHVDAGIILILVKMA